MSESVISTDVIHTLCLVGEIGRVVGGGVLGRDGRDKSQEREGAHIDRQESQGGTMLGHLFFPYLWHSRALGRSTAKTIYTNKPLIFQAPINSTILGSTWQLHFYSRSPLAPLPCRPPHFQTFCASNDTVYASTIKLLAGIYVAWKTPSEWALRDNAAMGAAHVVDACTPHRMFHLRYNEYSSSSRDSRPKYCIVSFSSHSSIDAILLPH